MSGVLYIVATPIGNLADIGQRAEETLKVVDLIAAEDTRHSARLLKHLGIKNKLISLHEHNEKTRIDKLVEKLIAGTNIALISDAGTPLISDPGYALVKAVHEAGLKVSPIPGPSSIIVALSGAGIPTDQFSFYGFLSHKNKERMDKLRAIKNQFGTLVLFESSHRIVRLLEQLMEVFPGRHIVVAKELTKVYERFLRGTAAQLLAMFAADISLSKGEFVVLIDNPDNMIARELNQEDIDLLRLLKTELPLKKAVLLASKISGKKKNALYQLALEID
ncbi:MAG: 16S rRNA (cytidine(1402)-2'-O)-methyltransferase [Proteobacteria bacterium]|nr:16S rRNA (cytidine(1402)-2'-O)-methyltransferase [Pseudomonadota bacterium]